MFSTLRRVASTAALVALSRRRPARRRRAGRAGRFAHLPRDRQDGQRASSWPTGTAHGGLAQQGYPISDEMQDVRDRRQDLHRAVLRARRASSCTRRTPARPMRCCWRAARRASATSDSYPRRRRARPEGQHRQPALRSRRPARPSAASSAPTGRATAAWPSRATRSPTSSRRRARSNGKTYTVQYFERAVFELHPENQAALRRAAGASSAPSRTRPSTDLSFTDSTGTQGHADQAPAAHRLPGLAVRGYPVSSWAWSRWPSATRSTSCPQFWGDQAKSFPAIGGGFGAPEPGRHRQAEARPGDRLHPAHRPARRAQAHRPAVHHEPGQVPGFARLPAARWAA